MSDALFAGLDRRPHRVALEHALREAVRSGRLLAGTPLPSTRALAVELGVARGTVVEAYGQLVAEGYLVSRQGAATRVAEHRARPAGTRTQALRGPGYRYDMRPGSPDPDAFPADAWTAAVRRVARSLPADGMSYGDPLGRIELREALSGYLARARGVAADPGRIAICSGFTLGVGLVIGALRELGVRRVGMEDPCLSFHRGVVRDALGDGGEVVAIGVDDEGAEARALAREDPDALLVTPAHQHPLGIAMSARRRSEVVAWATARGRYILEDDYDGELRYDRQPVGALQGLAPEQVVYLGTASKSLAPGVRIGWAVLPEALVGPVARRKMFRETVPAIDQLALADLIASGWFDRHLRKRRQAYRARRDLFVATITAAAPWVKVRGLAAGLNAVVELPPDGPTEEEVLRLAEARGVGTVGLGPHWHRGGAGRRFEGVVVGYGRPREHAAAGAFAALGEVLRDAASGTGR